MLCILSCLICLSSLYFKAVVCELLIYLKSFLKLMSYLEKVKTCCAQKSIQGCPYQGQLTLYGLVYNGCKKVSCSCFDVNDREAIMLLLVIYYVNAFFF